MQEGSRGFEYHTVSLRFQRCEAKVNGTTKMDVTWPNQLQICWMHRSLDMSTWSMVVEMTNLEIEVYSNVFQRLQCNNWNMKQFIPGPYKGCQMVAKGCQFNIPCGLLGTHWKVLVWFYGCSENQSRWSRNNKFIPKTVLHPLQSLPVSCCDEMHRCFVGQPDISLFPLYCFHGQLFVTLSFLCHKKNPQEYSRAPQHFPKKIWGEKYRRCRFFWYLLSAGSNQLFMWHCQRYKSNDQSVDPRLLGLPWMSRVIQK